MKTKIILFLFSTFISYYLMGQNGPYDVVYDVKKNSFAKKPKSVPKGKTAGIYLKHFNPFSYQKNVSLKNNDDSTKIFPFITGIFGNYFGAKVQVQAFTALGAHVSDNYKDFVKSYNDHLDLITSVRKHYFDCNSITQDISKLNGQPKNIIDLYLNLTPDEIKLHPDITLTKLSEIHGAVKGITNYNKKISGSSCQLKVADYKAKGTSVSINIELTPREEATSFGFPKDKIIGKTSLRINNTLQLSFSSGLFASFHVDPDYFVQQEVGGFIISKEGRGNVMPGVHSLAHISISNVEIVSLVLGGGVTIDAIPHFLTGTSFDLFKSKVNLNLGYGWAFGKTLSDGLSTETIYATAPTIKTKKKLLGTFWFGLSYKL